MTDPGAVALISTKYNPVFAHVFTTTTTAAAAISIIAVPSELVALPLPVGVGTSLDFHLDDHHVVLVLERRSIPTAVNAGARSGREYSGLEGRDEFRVLEVRLNLLGRVEDQRCVV